MLDRLKRYAEALAAAERALELDQKLAEAHTGKALALLGLERREEALAEVERSVQLTPDLAAAHTGRSLVLLVLLRFEEGLAAARRGVQLGGIEALTVAATAL